MIASNSFVNLFLKIKVAIEYSQWSYEYQYFDGENKEGRESRPSFQQNFCNLLEENVELEEVKSHFVSALEILITKVTTITLEHHLDGRGIRDICH